MATKATPGAVVMFQPSTTSDESCSINVAVAADDIRNAPKLASAAPTATDAHLNLLLIY
jgi:hypothetical protein